MADNDAEKNGNGSNGQDAPDSSPPPSAPDSADEQGTEPDEQPADSDGTEDEGDEDVEPSSEGDDDAEPAAEPSAEEPPAEPTVEEQLEATRKELAATKERVLRIAADFDNFRKRASRDVEMTRERGKQAAVRELLPVFDNLERAAGHGTEAADAKSIADGVRIVLKMFIDTLGKLGIERIDALGKAFDPMLHEGIQHDFSDEYAAGSVMTVFHSGYTMGKTLLRPALVVVSRGPKPAEEPEETNEPEAAGDAGEPAEPDALADAEPGETPPNGAAAASEPADGEGEPDGGAEDNATGE